MVVARPVVRSAGGYLVIAWAEAAPAWHQSGATM